MSASIFRKKATSVKSWSDGESSFESQTVLESADATTISTSSNRSSLILSGDGYASSDIAHGVASRLSLTGAPGKPKERPGHVEFVALQQELARFTSKAGPAKANILRLTLLPFLRQRMFEALPHSGEITFRVAVLEAWWSRLLAELQSKDHSALVANSDRAAYYEAISGILARPEWLTLGRRYAAMLAETVAAVLPKIAAPNLPLALGAFAGKVLAYAYYYSPGIAPVLLYLLRPKQTAVDRLAARTIRSESEPEYHTMCSVFPGHVQPLVGLQRVFAQPPPLPKEFGDLNGPWVRHWNPASGLFASFLKHYYSLLANLLPPESDNWLHAHMAAPGLFLVQAVIVSYLDRIVMSQAAAASAAAAAAGQIAGAGSADGSPPGGSPRRGRSPSRSPTRSRPASARPGSFGAVNGGGAAAAALLSPPPSPTLGPTKSSTIAPAPAAAAPAAPLPSPRVDRLRLLSCLREILHNEPSCVAYYRPFALQFDRIMQTVAATVSVYQMNSAVKLCDLLEEWISCVTLQHARSEQQVQVHKAGAVDWEFWVHVVGRMISTDNVYSEVRGLSLLFNIWPHLPRHQPTSTRPTPLLHAPELRAGLGPVAGLVFMPEGSDLMWATTAWLLSLPIWNRYFCHWNPLVRSYYQRLLVFRIASVGPASDWFCDLDAAKFLNDARGLLRTRLADAYGRCAGLAAQSTVAPATSPSLPVPSRTFAIGSNAAAQARPQTEIQRVYLYDIFDNAAYYSDAPSPVDGVVYEEPVGPEVISRRNSQRSSVESLRSVTSAASLSAEPAFSGAPAPAVASSTAAPRPSRPSSLNRTFSLFKKLLPGDSDPSSSTRSGSNVSTPHATSRSPGDDSDARSTKSGTSLKPRKAVKPAKAGKRKPSSKGVKFADPAALPAPWQLQEVRPEIARPHFRFNLVSTERAPEQAGAIPVPVLPYGEPVMAEPAQQFDDAEQYDQDLAYWNYGCRALAEWNEAARLFEEFACSQRRTRSSLDELTMPFMVAEIPWRTMG